MPVTMSLEPGSDCLAKKYGHSAINERALRDYRHETADEHGRIRSSTETNATLSIDRHEDL